MGLLEVLCALQMRAGTFQGIYLHFSPWSADPEMRRRKGVELLQESSEVSGRSVELSSTLRRKSVQNPVTLPDSCCLRRDELRRNDAPALFQAITRSWIAFTVARAARADPSCQPDNPDVWSPAK